MIRNLCAAGNVATWTFTGSVAMANALRRSLHQDVSTYAPIRVHVKENSTCQTDEYIAHRIGLIPFYAVRPAADASKVARLRVTGREAIAADIESEEFRPYNSRIAIIRMQDDQTLDVEIEFSWNNGGFHSRHSHVSTVSMHEQGGAIHMRLEMIDRSMAALPTLRVALQELQKMVWDTIHFIETQYDAKHKVLDGSSERTIPVV